MHILMTVNAGWNVVNFRTPLVKGLIADGHRLTVLTPDDGHAEALTGLGCAFVPLPMDLKGLAPHRDGALVWRFQREFRRLRPDCVLSFTIKNNIYGALAARRHGQPVLPNVTGLGTAFLSGRALQLVAEQLYRRAFARCPTVFFQNGDDRELFLDRRLVTAEQTRVLPGSGIDLAKFAPPKAPRPDGRPFTFLLIARLLRDKGVVEFAEAARTLRARLPDARFVLLGPLGADNRTAIPAETVESWVSEGIVEHHPPVGDVRPLIAEADCVVLPSYREGAPRTLLEAAAMGRPLIATDVPGCRSVVDDGVTGLLCAVRDADSLALAMARMAAMPPGQRAAMGRAGRAKMEREYDQAIVVDAYRDAIAASRRRPAA